MLKKQLLCTYPIQFLQDKLHGVMTGDMIMIAAGTGTGKSTLSRILIQHANGEGIPCVLFSLEDEPQTFVTDSVYRQYIKKAFEPLDFRQWLLDYSDNPEKYKEYAMEAAKIGTSRTQNGLKSVVVYEMKTPNWSLQEIIDTIKLHIEQGYKLFILDHMDVLVPSELPSDMVRAINDLWRLVAENHCANYLFAVGKQQKQRVVVCRH